MTKDNILASKARQKATLAQLLASENISVEIKSVDTAYFDLKNRHLVIPNYRDGISEEVYNLFVGHEVGHALDTPTDKWEQKIEKERFPHAIMNIVEDVRIEQNILAKFPGLKKDFKTAYVELFEKGFFGVKTTEELNKLPFLDRFNVKMKCGVDVDAYFTPEEMQIIEKSKKMSSWEDADKLSNEVFSYIKAEKTKKIDDKNKENASSNENDDSLPCSGNFVRRETPPLEDDGNLDFNFGAGNEVEAEDDIVSKTQQSFDESLKKMLNMLASEIINLSIPEPNIDKIITYKTILAKGNVLITSKGGVQSFVAYKKQSKYSVAYLTQLFYMRKNAKDLQNVQYNRTGNLDVTNIHEHTIRDDLFIRKLIETKGQSHGLQIFLDWSSSMEPTIQNSLYQLFILTDFCRNTNIPFDVYAFTSGQGQLATINKHMKLGDIKLNGIKLMHFLSSDMSREEYISMQQILFNHNTQSDLYMGGTPLNEAIVVAMDLTPKFKMRHNLDIVNVIFITDGDGSLAATYYTENNNANALANFQLSDNVYIHDRVTGFVEKFKSKSQQSKNITPILFRALEERIKANVVGFYLCPVKNMVHQSNKMDLDKLKNNGYLISTADGYSAYFIIAVRDTIDTKTSIESTNQKAFDSYLTKDTQLRTILQNFIELIT